MKKDYDLIILGAGAAGLTAGIYAGRYKLHTAIISINIGGMANYAKKIENYPGFEGSGIELMKKFYSQAKKFGCEFLNAEVAGLKKDRTGFVAVLANSKVVHSKAIIIALGTEKKKLGIEGEAKFLGKGVSYCATCDAYFFKNKDVAVIGSGNAACKAALLLSETARKVYIVCRNQLKCEGFKIDKIKEKQNIEIIQNSAAKKISGKTAVESIEIEQQGKTKKLEVSGVFIEIGSIPVTEIIKNLGVKVDENNYIEVNDKMETNISGVFAAGDAVRHDMKQVVVAASHGAIAAKSAYDYVR